MQIALIGNPNSGKTTVFNQLTGLTQKTGNFPGVTVEKKSGKFTLSSGVNAQIIDFPGAYSFYPTSKDESIVSTVLTNPYDAAHPDLILYIADSIQLEKHLLLLTQIKDLGIPTILAINRIDLSNEKGIEIDAELIAKTFDIPVIQISSRYGNKLDELKNLIEKELQLVSNLDLQKKERTVYQFSTIETKVAQQVGTLLGSDNQYRNLLLAHLSDKLAYLNESEKQGIAEIKRKENFESLAMQVREVMSRYDDQLAFLHQAIRLPKQELNNLTDRIDRVVTHKIFGPIIFFGIMFFVFQAIFSWAAFPMDLIESSMNSLSNFVKTTLPPSWFTDLLTDGIIAGLGGVLIFIPQIAILFFLVSLLDEIGYMARAVYIFDRTMQFFGLNGRSVVALISSGACAVPAIMATRTISNWKERLITILVSPFISCSARIPVYAVLVSFVVPPITVFGIFNAQGLVFMGLYLLGIIAALSSALVFKFILKSTGPSYLAMELPEYNKPAWGNILLNVKEKVMTFILEAGKIILIISIVLWFLASYGPSADMEMAHVETEKIALEKTLNESETADLLASKKLEASFAGHLGKFIEPVIRPLGFDWKIGIALISSFAAREVFVGTMATIYSVGSADDDTTIKARMKKETFSNTGLPVYTMAGSLSLLIFYVFAMQCMSTLAVVKRETNSWKWPIIQFLFMSTLAYFGSLIVFQLLH
ncbi:MAG TPA: ferrous iron transport protein B [Saprospiraceae bacterium]|nr:ferrous iron transport protein B [Saprospiraceae bacterium]